MCNESRNFGVVTKHNALRKVAKQVFNIVGTYTKEINRIR